VGAVFSGGGNRIDSELESAWLLMVPMLPFVDLFKQNDGPTSRLLIILSGGLGYGLIGSFFWFVASSVAQEVISRRSTGRQGCNRRTTRS
jgi:hypothetical protein